MLTQKELTDMRHHAACYGAEHRLRNLLKHCDEQAKMIADAYDVLFPFVPEHDANGNPLSLADKINRLRSAQTKHATPIDRETLHLSSGPAKMLVEVAGGRVVLNFIKTEDGDIAAFKLTEAEAIFAAFLLTKAANKV